ncbi:MAG: 16S rRNA (cytidine(1402)-2'-O)-methyltransferase [Marivibrio sp.]|uniref:16S rRNA (cytidine(1402)-2'-O)-methyltransferase n=1 Tax=Marivibrio sp. TaxID=2039719 RepID=UPI0032EF7ADE
MGETPGDRLPAGLYIVATPIGNLRDITLRALDVLGAADRIACEDTRVTAKLLAAYGLKKSLTPYHDHNAAAARPKLLDAIGRGEAVALVSDAGTPLVSDPGYKLAAEAAAAGFAVTPIPGASAALAALSAAGLPSDKFLFAGFPPPKAGKRARWLAGLLAIDATLILYEGPSRLADALAAIAETARDRPVAVMRELTKLYEEHRRGTAAALADHYKTAGPPKGEVVIVVGPPGADEAEAPDLDALLQDALAAMSVKDAAKIVAAATGLPKKDVYARALTLAKPDGA